MSGDDEVVEALEELRRQSERNAWIIAGVVAAVPFSFLLARLLRRHR